MCDGLPHNQIFLFAERRKRTVSRCGTKALPLKRNIKTLQRYEYEEPYEITQDVTVQANGEAVVNFDLVLRSGT